MVRFFTMWHIKHPSRLPVSHIPWYHMNKLPRLSCRSVCQWSQFDHLIDDDRGFFITYSHEKCTFHSTSSGLYFHPRELLGQRFEDNGRIHATHFDRPSYFNPCLMPHRLRKYHDSTCSAPKIVMVSDSEKKQFRLDEIRLNCHKTP